MNSPDDKPAGDEISGERLDPAVVAALYVEHADELRRFLTGVLKDPHWANDALQATFVKAVESGQKARPDSLKGWLFTVAFHEALALRRKKTTEDKHQRQMANEDSSESSTPLPESSLVRRESVARVTAALEKLPDEQKQVVRMRLYDEKKFAEIADELKIPLGTVLTRMRSALEKLRRSLKES